MSETGKSDWSTLRVLVVAAGVEGVVAGLVIVVLAAIPLSRTRGYKDLAEENLSDYEMDNYMEAYKFDVRSNGAALLSSLISAVVDGFLVAGAVILEVMEAASESIEPT